MSGETTYSSLRRQRADRPEGEFLAAKNYPNGVDVTVVRIEIGYGYSANPQVKGPEVPVWVVTSNAKEFDGEKKLNESGFMSGKLEELNIEDPTGKRFVLAQEEYKGNKTFRIARAL